MVRWLPPRSILRRSGVELFPTPRCACSSFARRRQKMDRRRKNERGRIERRMMDLSPSFNPERAGGIPGITGRTKKNGEDGSVGNDLGPSVLDRCTPRLPREIFSRNCHLSIYSSSSTGASKRDAPAPCAPMPHPCHLFSSCSGNASRLIRTAKKIHIGAA